MELWSVVESGEVEVLAQLLPRVADINARNRNGMTLLMKAAACGHAEVVRLLLDHGADPNVTRNDGFTALALAAFFGHTETVKVLMEFGAHTEAVTRSGASAHTWATARTFAEVARCLNTPSAKKEPTQLRRRPSRSRILALGVVASVVLMVCCGLGALVLNTSQAHDLPPKVLPPSPPVTKVESAPVTSPQPEVRATIKPTIKKLVAPPRQMKSVSEVTEKPVEQPAEQVQVSEPLVVVKPKFESPRPPPLSPQIIAPTKKAKVIQWP
ncbi:MAG TPA: ankyrin repeat domain-containing protein [Pyrinomonadaceae bacterium]|nr:ankyrin repeat domain-containing protein [Pyrinomonadaceae bacterium]